MNNLEKLFTECLTAPYKTAENNVNYLTVKEKGHIKIYFEQSRDAADWKANLDFPCKPYSSMHGVWFCHRGFAKAWKSIEPYIAREIKGADIHTVTIVGYSHGAALAALCHEYIWFNRPDLRSNIFGYGFGSPRIFWGFYIPKIYKKRWENFCVIRNADDIVTHMPPLVLGYRHVTPPVIIGKKGKYSSVSAHLAKNYITELKRADLVDNSEICPVNQSI